MTPGLKSYAQSAVKSLQQPQLPAEMRSQPNVHLIGPVVRCFRALEPVERELRMIPGALREAVEATAAAGLPMLVLRNQLTAIGLPQYVELGPRDPDGRGVVGIVAMSAPGFGNFIQVSFASLTGRRFATAKAAHEAAAAMPCRDAGWRAISLYVGR